MQRDGYCHVLAGDLVMVEVNVCVWRTEKNLACSSMIQVESAKVGAAPD
jgi:hypothetical protein